jgi:hypothetical protein
VACFLCLFCCFSGAGPLFLFLRFFVPWGLTSCVSCAIMCLSVGGSLGWSPGLFLGGVSWSLLVSFLAVGLGLLCSLPPLPFVPRVAGGAARSPPAGARLARSVAFVWRSAGARPSRPCWSCLVRVRVPPPAAWPPALALAAGLPLSRPALPVLSFGSPWRVALPRVPRAARPRLSRRRACLVSRALVFLGVCCGRFCSFSCCSLGLVRVPLWRSAVGFVPPVIARVFGCRRGRRVFIARWRLPVRRALGAPPPGRCACGPARWRSVVGFRALRSAALVALAWLRWPFVARLGWRGRVLAPAVVGRLSSLMASFGVCGSRALGPPWSGWVRAVVAGALRAGFSSVTTGCASGADAAARAACPPGRLVVFAVASGRFGSGRSAFARRSAALVRALARDPGSALAGFVRSPCPPGVTPARAWRSGRPASGSWSSLALAVGLGLPILVFWCAPGPPALPAWSGGEWSPARVGALPCWVWPPPATPPRLPGL